MLNDIFVKEKGANVKYAKPEKNKVKRRMLCFVGCPRR